MAALFCGATWTPLTSIVFAFETTLRPNGLAPIVAGCTTSFLVSCALMRDNILTEKFARRGGRALFKPHADFMDSVMVIDACTRNPVCIRADETAQEPRIKLSTDEKYIPYDGFPVLDDKNHLVGVLANHDLLSPDIDPPTARGHLWRLCPAAGRPDDESTPRGAADCHGPGSPIRDLGHHYLRRSAHGSPPAKLNFRSEFNAGRDVKRLQGRWPAARSAARHCRYNQVHRDRWRRR